MMRLISAMYGKTCRRNSGNLVKIFPNDHTRCEDEDEDEDEDKDKDKDEDEDEDSAIIISS
jgi:hypothetical protein